MPSITIEEMKNIPAPIHTKTWKPVPHHEVMGQVEKALSTVGISILDTRIDADKAGTNVFVTHKLNFDFDEEVMKHGGHPQIGWRNSHNKKFSLGFTCGKHITVCSNLVFNGTWMEFQKHDVNMNEHIISAMTFKGTSHVIQETYKSITFEQQMLSEARGKHHADHLFMEMLRTGVVSSKQIMDLSNGFDEERERYGENLYSIFNAATQTFRELTLPTISERSFLLNNLIRKDMGLDQVIDLEVIPEEEMAAA